MDSDEQLAVIEPAWPPISQDEAETAGLAFGLSEPKLIRNTSRMMASSCLIEAGCKQYFLKRLSPQLASIAELELKHHAINSIANQLASRRWAHPQRKPRLLPYLTTPHGDTVVYADGWCYELTECLIGDDRYQTSHSWQFPNSTKEAWHLGFALASYHLAAEKLSAELPSQCPIGAYQTRFELIPGLPDSLFDFLVARPVLKDWLAQTGRNLRLDLTRFPIDHELLADYQQLPKIWMHGDAHISNCSFIGDEVASIFDFGLTNPGTAIADLATCLERNTIGWVEILAGDSDNYQLPIAEAILAGYQQVRPLTNYEKQLLPAILPVIHFEPALNFIPYHLFTNKPENAVWSYANYFLGHGKWFLASDGLDYLAGLTKLLAD